MEKNRKKVQKRTRKEGSQGERGAKERKDTNQPVLQFALSVI
jgi:hypothetical protein